MSASFNIQSNMSMQPQTSIYEFINDSDSQRETKQFDSTISQERIQMLEEKFGLNYSPQYEINPRK